MLWHNLPLGKKEHKITVLIQIQRRLYITDTIFRGVFSKHHFWVGSKEEDKVKNINIFN